MSNYNGKNLNPPYTANRECAASTLKTERKDFYGRLSGSPNDEPPTCKARTLPGFSDFCSACRLRGYDDVCPDANGHFNARRYAGARMRNAVPCFI